jgi:hypothetical protein
VVAPSFLHVGGSSYCLVAAMSCADFRGRIDGAKCQSLTSVGEVRAEERREKFLCTHPESNRQPLAYETSMVPQDHCQCTVCTMSGMRRTTEIYQLSMCLRQIICLPLSTTRWRYYSRSKVTHAICEKCYKNFCF